MPPASKPSLPAGAVGVCAMCGKPVMPGEIVRSESGIFCSQSCAKDMAKAAGKVKNQLAKARGGGFIKWVVSGVVLAAVLALALHVIGVIDLLDYF